MAFKFKRKTNLRVTTSIELSGKGIVDILKDNGIIPDNASEITVVVRIPSGGDYSGTDLDIHDTEHSITVSYTTTAVS